MTTDQLRQVIREEVSSIVREELTPLNARMTQVEQGQVQLNARMTQIARSLATLATGQVQLLQLVNEIHDRVIMIEEEDESWKGEE